MNLEKIMKDAVKLVEKEYPTLSDYEKYRLLQVTLEMVWSKRNRRADIPDR